MNPSYYFLNPKSGEGFNIVQTTHPQFRLHCYGGTLCPLSCFSTISRLRDRQTVNRESSDAQFIERLQAFTPKKV